MSICLYSKSNYLKSPLNYTGGKYYLLKQILPLFPENIDTFVDLFAGGCNLSINVDAKAIIANDTNKYIIELYKYFKENDSKEIVNEIEKIIVDFGLSDSSKYGFEYYNTTSMLGLSKYNKTAYEKLRFEYNKDKTPLMFFTTLIFAFNNQIRFNPKGEFNSHVNKRDFNDYMKRNLVAFIDKLNTLNIGFTCSEYEDVEIPQNAFVYLDPPYLASQAVYSENGAWDDAKEMKLMEYIDALDAKGIKFALSNVLSNKGKVNLLLEQWSKKYNLHKLNYTYHNCNYQAKNKRNNTTQEVLITNY